MMSFSMVKSASGADHYFMEADNYYLQSDEYKDRFTWWGQGAAKLRLTGSIEREAFLNALQGKLPNGALIPVSVNGTRRPGFDLTFSAPKSVSILALVYGKHELIEAHQEAVNTVLEVIEQSAAQARIKEGGVPKIELTKNLIVAQFLHDTSRELDANLHTHALVVNATERSDGEWRALASNTKEGKEQAPLKGFFEHIYQDQIYYSTIYRSTLANILTSQLGYEIELLPEQEGGRHGMFEIKGFPEDLKKHFSKRRDQIEKLLEERAETTGIKDISSKTKDFLTLTSRRAKEAVDRGQLHDRWMEDIEGHFQDFDPASLQKTGKTSEDELEKMRAAREAVMDATRHFAESRLVFTYKDLATKSMQFGLGKAPFEAVNTAIKHLREEKVLVSLSESEMTSKDILAYEKALLEKTHQLKKSETATPKLNEKVLNQMDASEHHKNTVREILASREGIAIVNMSVYDHPEQWIETFLNTAEHSGHRVQVLTPTKTHLNELGQKIKRRSFNVWQWVINHFNPSLTPQTVRGYLYRHQDGEGEVEKDPFASLWGHKNETLVLIDSAHRLGYQDLEGLQRVAQSRGAKLIFLHSEDALKGGGVGSPIDVMRKAKVKEYDLTEKNALPPHAIYTVVLEVPDDEARSDMIAKRYGDLSEAAQRETYVVAHTHKQADLLNQKIRNVLKNKGVLARSECMVKTLNPVYLTAVEKKYASQYKNDMVLKRFNKNGVETYLVLKYIEEDNTVLLLNENQEKIFWNPQKTNWKTALYKKGELGIVEGDRLIATDTMGHLNIESGHGFAVRSLSPKEIGVLNETSGEILTLRLSDLKDSAFKHAYASTLLRAPKERRTHLIADIKGFAATSEMMHELKSRATGTIDILTDHADKLLSQAQKAQLKTSATDTLITRKVEIPELQKYITGDTIAHFEEDFEQIATLLCEKYKGIDQRSLTQKSLEYVISKLSEREAAFLHHAVLTEALQYGIAVQASSGSQETVSLINLQEELKAYQNTQKLHLSQNKTYWVTREALACERDIIKLSKEGVGQVEALLSKEEAFDKLNPSEGLHGLTTSQKNAAHLILTTQDRFVMIQGDPGTGKTSMVSRVKEILNEVGQVCADKGVKIRGIAPTYQAVKELEAIGIPSQTLKSFLIEHARGMEEPIDYSKTLFIMDEYSMVANEDARDFKQVVQACKGRAVHLGDIKQFEAVPAGRPMYIELEAGIQSVRMEELVRQQNEDAKSVAKAAIKGDVKGVLEAAQKVDARQFIERDESRMTLDEQLRLEHSVHECQDLENACAREYVLRTQEVRAKTPIIVQNHKKRAIINHLIREELKQNQELPKTGGLLLNRLIRMDVLKTDIKEANVGSASHIRLGKNYFQIERVDRKNKAFLLRGEDGKVEAFDPKRDFLRFKENYEVFRLEQQEIVLGDLIMLRKNDLKRGHRANVDYHVKGIAEDTIHLENRQDGTELALNAGLLQDAHWDYAYTKTGYSMQGASAAFPIIHLSSKEEKLAHVRSICIAATRHKDHCMIFTDDRARVIEKFSRENNKLSALEVMGELSQPEKQIKPSSAVPIVYEHFDAKDIESRLKDQAETVVEHLLGQRNHSISSGTDWRYGKKGSLSVKVGGEHAGHWHHFETGEGGNLLSLIQQELQLDFKGALRYGANLVGGRRLVSLSKKQNHSSSSPQKTDKQKGQWKAQEVQRYFREALPIEGSLAERYLREHRGITGVKGTNLRFHPKLYSHEKTHLPGLVAFAMDDQGRPTGMQAIYLDEHTGDKRRDLPIGKRSFGQIGGSHITLSEGKGRSTDTISFIAEGVETALSIRDAAPGHHVIATLSKSNFKNVDPNRLAKIVLLCIDNDSAGTIKHGKVVSEAIDKLEKAGKEVYITIPKKEGADFNDVLKQEGKAAVQKALQNKLTGQQFKDRIKAFEVEKQAALKVVNQLKKEDLLNGIGKRELEHLMKAFDQVKVGRNFAPKGRMHEMELGH